MRLLSATIRNYRVHRELTVRFDAQLTVIGGPNESGKSTLVEAMHRALFMRHKASGADLTDMRSHYGGHPEVELAFEAQGRRCLLRKVFKGPSGTAVLEEDGQSPRHGDIAEQRLAELLGESEAARKWSSGRWSHLWVWQGQSFDDPTAGTNERADDLVHRFQSNGAAVVQLSSRDTRVAEHFATLVNDRFNKNGSPKKGTPLEQAMERHRAATQEVADRTVALERLFDAARRLESARATLREVAGSLAEHEQELQEALGRQQQLTALRSRAQLEESDASQKREQWEALVARERTIRELREQVAQLTERLAPMQRHAEALAQDEQAARTSLDEIQRQLTDVDDVVREANARATLATAFRTRLELQQQHQELETRVGRAREASDAAARLRLQLASLPLMDADTFRAIETASRDLQLAEATLAAIATRVEVLRADGEVRLGNDALTVGNAQIITAQTELAIGPATTVRIVPGGGASVADAERARAECQRMLHELLQQAGVSSLGEARQLLEQRTALGDELRLHERRLDELDLAALESQQQTLTARLAETDADIARRRGQRTELTGPTDLASAQLLCSTIGKALVAAEEQLQLLVDARAEAQTRLNTAQQAHTAHAESMAVQQRELDTHQRTLDAQLSVHGSDIERAEALTKADALHQQAARVVQATHDEMAALDPDGVDELVRMLSTATKTLTERRTSAKQDEFAAQRELQQDGSRDPHAELSLAEARERDAREYLARLQLQANAIRTLHDLYTAEQRQLSEQFAKPLRARADKYLRVVLPDSSLHVDYDNREFGGLAVLRGSTRTPYQFDTLSTGAREQVGTALRLGVAEVLAEGHGGTLPVVFDDAFAYSDPDRLKLLRRMLFRAAESGLQVIVLSCNPTDYDGLGLRITLERPADAVSVASAVGVAAAGSNEATDDEDDDEAVGPGSTFTAGPVADEDLTTFLAVLSDGAGSRGNNSLREALGWDEARYDAVRDALRAAGRIVIGRGRGGSVSLPGQ